MPDLTSDTQDAIQPGIYVDKSRGERRTVTDAKNGRVHYTFNDGRSGGSMPIDQWRSRHYEPVPTSTVATFGEPKYDIVAALRANVKERVSDPIKYAAADEIEILRRERDGLSRLLEAHVLEEKRIRKGIARAHSWACTTAYDRCALCQLAGRYATEDSLDA